LLRVSDWLTSEDEKTKLRPSFTPGSGGGFAFRRNDIFKPGMDFRGSIYFGVRTRRNFYAGLRDAQLLSSRFGIEAAGFYARLPDETLALAIIYVFVRLTLVRTFVSRWPGKVRLFAYKMAS